MSPSKVHFLSRFLVLRAIPRWWDHDWHLGCAIRQRIDSYFWISEPKMSVLDCLEMEFRFQVHGCQATCTNWTSVTGPIIVSPRISAWALDCGFTRGCVCVCVLGILGWNLQHRRPRQEWSCSSYLPIPCTRTMRLSKPFRNESSRTVIRSPECFPAQCFQTLVLEKTPKGSLLVNSLFSFPLFTDSTFSRVLSCPFSSSVKPNCAQKLETAL